ncbi:protein adenylyltransferase SelO [Moraxella catarrhalis]|uniref:protein adenylyltransferase SelO n=1 Tax=Moraxella catarrhalis TaxID=480 RepID=UPI000EAA9329|nr:YdiU family protein [Moraxella catarrhalis]MPW57294.1 YdiU family protein [Moraxella catarrhalis]MPW60049.1 YdiU family protein [Moraxella catarrhalis]RKL76224.1 YdiU family protein [Moraxella catarrhalis]
MKFIHDYLKHDDRLYRHTLPTPLDNPKLVSLNTQLIDQLGLSSLDATAWADIISGRLSPLTQIAPHKIQPIAMAYAGHQFGQWAGQLGDGRGVLIAQLHNKKTGKLIDLHLKGAGLTSYSRRGDGRAMLASCIREYLGGHALNGLMIASSDAIGLVVSDTHIQRRHIEKAAALLRVSDCHVRLGHFEWVAMYAADYFETFVIKIIQSYYLHLYDAHQNTANISQLLHEIAANTARMIAKWQLIGFCHGVMNTDNLNITGTTLDFGPFAFMEGFNPTWINNHSDHTGRYVYQNQPTIGHWNLAVVYHHFKRLVNQDDIDDALMTYQEVFENTYHHGLCQKLGIKPSHQAIQLGYRLLMLMQNERLDYTNTFRALIAVADHGENRTQFTHEYTLLANLTNILSATSYDIWQNWVNDYLDCLKQQSTKQTAIKTLQQTNPIYILRNHMAERAIVSAHQGDFDEVARLFALLDNPYQQQTIATVDDTRMAFANEVVAVSCLS